jgi:hypothetical protein
MVISWFLPWRPVPLPGSHELKRYKLLIRQLKIASGPAQYPDEHSANAAFFCAAEIAAVSEFLLKRLKCLSI